jgi:hypothetical protein
VPASRQPRIIIFTGSSSSWCDRVKQYLKEQGFRFREFAENIKVGDRIVFAKFTGDKVEFEGIKYLIVSRSDILAIIK